MLSGKYNTRTCDILLNPCQSKSEFGITFIHELYHDYINVSCAHLSRRLEERNAEQYAQEMYDLYSEEIDKYLHERGLE